MPWTLKAIFQHHGQQQQLYHSGMALYNSITFYYFRPINKSPQDAHSQLVIYLKFSAGPYSFFTCWWGFPMHFQEGTWDSPISDKKNLLCEPQRKSKTWPTKLSLGKQTSLGQWESHGTLEQRQMAFVKPWVSNAWVEMIYIFWIIMWWQYLLCYFLHLCTVSWKSLCVSFTFAVVYLSFSRNLCLDLETKKQSVPVILVLSCRLWTKQYFWQISINSGEASI